MSADWETARQAGPARRRLGVPAAFAVAALILVVLAVSARGEPEGSLVVEQTETPVAEETAPAIPVAPGDWQAMAPGPLSPREDAAAVWSGTEMLVWGGRVRDRLDALRDGAAYEPLGDRWRALPRSPLSARGSPAAAWTGRELVLWGGAGDQPEVDEGREVLGIPLADGAAYDPATNRWRELAPSPLSARRDAQAVVIDGQVVIWGGTTFLGGHHFTDGAIYDPNDDTWRMLPPSPLEGREDTDIKVVSVAGGVFIVASTFRGIAVATYDPATDSWDSGFGSPPLRGDLPIAAVGIEDAVVIWGEARTPDGSPMAFRYTPSSREWRTVDRPPQAPTRRDELTNAGTRAVSFEHDHGLVFDGATNRWASMPEAPELPPGGAVEVWTGDRLLIWYSSGIPDDPNRAAAWVPAETW